MGFHSYRGEFLKGYDRYAKAVSLTYLKSGTYRTGAGGICSIISFTLLFYWLCVNVFFALWKYGSYTVSSSNGLTQDDQGVYPLYELTKLDFMVAFDIIDITTGTDVTADVEKYA